MDQTTKVLAAIAAGPKKRGELQKLVKASYELGLILEELIDTKKIARKGHGRGTHYVARVNGSHPAPAPRAAGAKGRVVHGYAIEAGIPVPALTGPNSPLVQALCALEAGESVVHTNKSKSAIHSKPVKSTGHKFTSRSIGAGKWRIWRIS